MANAAWRLTAGVATACAVMVAAVTCGAAVNAAARPALTLSFTTSEVNAGEAATASYTVTGLPTGTKLELQRKTGSKWRTSAQLPTASGQASVPGLSQGAYTFRVAALKGGKVIATSPIASMHAYADVPFWKMCSAPGASTQYGCKVEQDSWVIGGRAFPVQAEDTLFNEGNYVYGFTFHPKTCRTLSVQFAAENNQQGMNLQAVQATLDPQTSTAQPGTIGQATFSLDGGVLRLGAQRIGGSYSQPYGLSGVFSCYTTNGANG